VLLPLQRGMLGRGTIKSSTPQVRQIKCDRCHDGHRYRQEFVPCRWSCSARRDRPAAEMEDRSSWRRSVGCSGGWHMQDDQQPKAAEKSWPWPRPRLCLMRMYYERVALRYLSLRRRRKRAPLGAGRVLSAQFRSILSLRLRGAAHCWNGSLVSRAAASYSETAAVSNDVQVASG